MSEQDLTELHIPENMHIEHEREPDEREPDKERPLSARDEMMKLISQRREEAINRELRHGEDLADQAREDSGLERLEREPEHDDTEAEAEPARREPVVHEKPIEKPAAPALRSIEIDGQQFNVTEEQYRQLAEQGVRTNVALSKHNQQPAPQPAPQAREPAAEPQARRGVLSKEDADAVADRLLYGGKDQVAATVQALADHIANQTRQEQVDQEKITSEATRRAVQQTQEQAQLQYDLQVISAEYPTIWPHRALGELAAIHLSHVRKEDAATGRARSNLDAYREACNLTLDALGQPRPGTTPPPATQAAPARAASPAPVADRSQVLERKRVAPPQPTAVDRRASASQTTRVKSGAEIVEQMRKSRGQMAMN